MSGGRDITRRAALLALLVGLVLTSPALAVDPPRLTGQITDQAGVLDGSTSQVQTALDSLLADDGVQLFVLYVDSTDDFTATEFADETARINSLGGDDALLAVAVDDRTDAIWASDALPITDQELDSIIADRLEPELRDGDFAGAAIATAQGLGAAAGGAGGGGTESGGLGLGTLVGIVLLGLGIVVLAMWLVAKLRSRREAEEHDRQTGKLAREANALLIATDERVRAADQEAGFVEAEFGPGEAAPFRTAVAAAREELQGAFAIRQRLDDSEPEDAPTRQAMLQEIVERSARAGASLDQQTARLDELRNLEREAPKILDALPAQADDLEARLPAAEAALAALMAGYAEPAWAVVKGNVIEARKGLRGARDAIDRGAGALAAGRPADTVKEIVVAQQGIAGAGALMDAIETAARTVRETQAGLGAQLDAAAADLASAQAAAAADRPEGAGHDAAIAGAEAALRAARVAVAARPPEPIAASRAVADAQRRASEVLAAVRKDAEQQAQLAAALGASFTAARAEVDRAGEFFATRHGGVQRRARTRLAEAERLLAHAEAIRDTDPKQAMDEARRADQLAGEAYALATSDFQQWDQTGRSAQPAGNDVAGAILGGIIGGILTGGGRGAGWGGSTWGAPDSPIGRVPLPGPFGGGGGGWGGGSRGGGGFGGFGGGGSGHSRGGRW